MARMVDVKGVGGGVETRVLSVGRNVEGVRRGSRQAPPWMYLSFFLES